MRPGSLEGPAQVDVRFGSEADICSAKRHVRFTPESGPWEMRLECPLSAKSGHRQLFDHLVGAGEERRWQLEAERFGSFEVDDKT